MPPKLRQHNFLPQPSRFNSGNDASRSATKHTNIRLDHLSVQAQTTNERERNSFKNTSKHAVAMIDSARIGTKQKSALGKPRAPGD
jgi:hypothetical protein